MAPGSPEGDNKVRDYWNGERCRRVFCAKIPLLEYKKTAAEQAIHRYISAKREKTMLEKTAKKSLVFDAYNSSRAVG